MQSRIDLIAAIAFFSGPFCLSYINMQKVLLVRMYNAAVATALTCMSYRRYQTQSLPW